jgi:hypothetical protein
MKFFLKVFLQYKRLINNQQVLTVAQNHLKLETIKTLDKK